MTVLASTIRFESQSEVQFRLWGKAISDGLKAAGLIQTADTGQIDWATVLRVNSTTAGEQVTGYEMFRFSDALQATAPIFIKVEYGTANGVNPSEANRVWRTSLLLVTVGQSTNGVGTLTTPNTIGTRTRIMGNQQMGAAGLGAGTEASGNINGSSPCFFQGDGSSVAMALGVQADAQPFFVVHAVNGWTASASLPVIMLIERSRNADGTPNGDGCIFAQSHWEFNSTWYVGNSTHTPFITYQITSFTGMGISAAQSRWPLAWNGSAYNTSLLGSDLYPAPLSMSTPKTQAACLGVLGIYKTDIPINSLIQVFVSGQLRTYRSLTQLAGHISNSNERSYVDSVVINGALLMRWD